MELPGESRILLIDHSPANLDQLRSLMGEEVTIDYAGSAEEAMKMAGAAQPHIILLDLTSPDYDGYELCRALKTTPATRDIPVLLLSRRASDEDEEKGLQLGAVDYISRPLSSLIVYARLLNHLEMARANAELKRLATTDSLTGVFNRRHFLELAGKELARMHRYHHAVSCLMLDIDHFKRVNDTYGHDVGDQAIIATAATAKKALRTEDVFGRLGGEEFAAMLPMTSLEKAQQVAERLRMSIAAIRIPTKNVEVTFTASIGLVEIAASGESFEQAIKRADEALYEAKRRGRDRVVSRPSEDVEPVAVTGGPPVAQQARA